MRLSEGDKSPSVEFSTLGGAGVKALTERTHDRCLVLERGADAAYPDHVGVAGDARR
jgi:hypothetical protein